MCRFRAEDGATSSTASVDSSEQSEDRVWPAWSACRIYFFQVPSMYLLSFYLPWGLILILHHPLDVSVYIKYEPAEEFADWRGQLKPIAWWSQGTKVWLTKIMSCCRVVHGSCPHCWAYVQASTSFLSWIIDRKSVKEEETGRTLALLWSHTKTINSPGIRPDKSFSPTTSLPKHSHYNFALLIALWAITPLSC